MTPLLHVAPSRRLDITRMPGEWGPVLRCTGELTVATAEVLRRELDLLVPLGHPAITLNLNNCTYLDVDGVLALLEAYKRLHDNARTLVLVAGRGGLSTALQTLGVDWVVPLFPTEAAAAQALRGGGPPAPAPSTWEQARQETMSVWRRACEALDSGSRGEVMQQMTGFHPLCERSEEMLQGKHVPDGIRCRLCPLFAALGGRQEDVGCISIRSPIMKALASGDVNSARRLMQRVIALLEAMPLPGSVPKLKLA